MWTYVPEPGRPAPLRASLISAIQLPAEVGAQIGIVSDEYQALVDGRPWTFTSERLKALAPPGHPDLPDDIDAFPLWLLEGGGTLHGVANE